MQNQSTLEDSLTTFVAMGSPCEIRIEGLAPQERALISADLIAEIERLEAKYSRYRETSLLSGINRAAAVGGRVEVDDETAGLLDYAEACHVQSDGLFDITSGILREAWPFSQRTQLRLPPSRAQLAPLLARVGWEKLRWQRPVLAFGATGMALDFGGIVKEYAADCAAALATAQGVRHGLINLGGDIRIIGNRADGDPWRIGIRDPGSSDALMATVALSSGGLTTSGDYARCFMIDGVRYGHLLNPRTGWPVRALSAVTVTADLCVIAGSASTIAMLKEDAGPAWLEALGLPHLWVAADGQRGGTLPGARAEK